jgi:cell division transport system permease protein
MKGDCMSTIEPLDSRIKIQAEPWDDLEVSPLRAHWPRVATAIVAKGSIAGRSLIAVVAIMTFLAGLTAGAVMMVVGAASDWSSDVGREVTIQVRPVAGRDLDADVRKTVEITRGTPGIADVQVYSKEESARLVEPWLGNGLNLNDLPIPRGQALVRRAAGFRRAAQGARGTGAKREPRRSSPLDRPHA